VSASPSLAPTAPDAPSLGGVELRVPSVNAGTVPVFHRVFDGFERQWIPRFRPLPAARNSRPIARDRKPPCSRRDFQIRHGTRPLGPKSQPWFHSAGET